MPDTSRESSFLDHLGELHVRVTRALLALVLGGLVGWWLYDPFFAWFTAPVTDQIRLINGGQIVINHPAEAFFVKLKFAVVLGIVIASPWVFYQLWAFIRPGLHPRERRVIRPLLPAVGLLFIAGAALARVMLPAIVKFFLSFNPANVTPMVHFQTALDLPLKTMLAFGIVFQLPVVLLGLIWLGILTPAFLLKQWRAAIVIIAIVAAVATPTPDPLNMAIMMAPLLVLYFGTILFAHKFVKPRNADDGGPTP